MSFIIPYTAFVLGGIVGFALHMLLENLRPAQPALGFPLRDSAGNLVLCDRRLADRRVT